MKFIGRVQDDILLQTEDEIVIYGCGRTGKQVYAELKERGLASKVLAFCDENPNLRGKKIEGIPIVSVTDASQKYKGAAYLIASCCIKDMINILQKNNVDNIHITRV